MGTKAYYVFSKGPSREELWKGLLLEPAPKPESARIREEFMATWGENLGRLSDASVLEEFKRRYSEAKFSGSERGTIYAYGLLSGWYYIELHMYSTTIFEDKALLPKLSGASETIFCSLHEGVMCSSSSFWKNGEEVWYVEHWAQEGPDHLVLRGTMPDSFASVIEQVNQKHLEQERQKREADPNMPRDIFFGNIDYFFDAPLLLVENLTGWKYNRKLPVDGEPDYLTFRSDHPTA